MEFLSLFPRKMPYRRRIYLPSRRNRHGQQASEFAGALVILLVFIAVPMVDLGIIPVRLGLAQALVGNEVRKLALEEKTSRAFKSVEEGHELKDALKALGGVELKSLELALAIESSRSDSSRKIVTRPGSIPADWLPDGAHCPCNYMLNLKVEADVHPLVTAPLPGQSIPGLTGPVRAAFVEVSHWENLGRDPSSGEFFVNE